MPPRRSSRPATTTLSSTPQSGGSQGRKRKSSLPATSKTASPNTIRHSKRIRNVQGDSKLESETPTITKTDTVTQSKKKTRRTSRYFSEDDTSSPRSTGSEDPGNEESESGYEEGQAEAPTTESSVTEDEDDVYSEGEEVRTPKNKKAGRPPKSLEVVGKIKDLWRSGVSTGLGPGKQVIVRLPKARAAGKTPYTDETIHPNTLLFLKDLAQNNEREWLKMHDADFRSSEKDFDSFVAALTEKIIEKDETIPELPVKDIKFRIYRDIRFSPDPTPYKPYFSAAWSRTGRKGPYAAYYLQIQPGKSFIGGGLWHPEAQPLALLRQDIDQNPHRIKRTLMNQGLRQEYLGQTSKDERKVVKAFIKHNNDNALKTKPKGFEKDHPNLDLLRLRNYTIGRKLEDSQVVGPLGLEQIAELMGTLTPFVTYLNGVVMPDNDPHPPSSTAGSSDDGEDETEGGSD